VTPDFTMPAGCAAGGGGTVCSAAAVALWRRIRPIGTDGFATHVDWWACGTYAGPSNVRTGTPTQLNGDGQASAPAPRRQRRRLCGSDPATPQNNAGDMIVARTSPFAARRR
jgi:hypothetical protein